MKIRWKYDDSRWQLERRIRMVLRAIATAAVWSVPAIALIHTIAMGFK